MRWPLVLAVALLALSACVVKEEGRICASGADCPAGQGCGFDGRCSKACDSTSCMGSALSCDPGMPGQTLARECERVPDSVCGRWRTVATCQDDSQTCDRALASCACKPANGCGGGSGNYTTCEVPTYASRLSCEVRNGCHLLVSSTACATGETCADGACVSKIQNVEITSPSGQTTVGPKGASVTVLVTVTMGSPAVTPLPTLDLRQDGVSVGGNFGPPGQSGTVVTYSGSYSPGEGLEKDVALTVIAEAAGAQRESQAVTLRVDTKPPAVSGFTASCGTGGGADCQRDDEVVVAFSAVDSSGVASAQVSLDLDDHVAQPAATRSTGDAFSSVLKLGDAATGWPFKHLAHRTAVNVTAIDGLGNQGTTEAGTFQVTRLRSAVQIAPAAPMTGPALLADGTLVVGLAANSGQLRGFPPAPALPWNWTLDTGSGGRPVLWAPAAGDRNLWVASEDGRIHRAPLDGTTPPVGTLRYPPDDPIAFPFAPLRAAAVRVVPGSPPVDRAYAAGGASTAWQFWSSGVTGGVPMGQQATAAPVFSGDKLFVATGPAGGPAKLRRISDAVLPVAEADTELDDGTGAKCDEIQELAIDGAGNVVAACRNGQLHRVPASFTAGVQGTLLASMNQPVTAPMLIVGVDNDVVLALDDGFVRAYRAGSSTPVWSADIGGGAGDRVTGLTAHVVGTAGARFHAVTRQGRVISLDQRGTELWSGPVDPGSALSPPVVTPLQAPPRHPALCAGSVKGKLLCVVVDAALDSGPWPKARHDNRNTGNAASPLP